VVRKLGGEVMQFRGANMAEVAAFVRKARQQLPAGFTETMLRQVSASFGKAPPDLLCRLMGTLALLPRHEDCWLLSGLARSLWLV